MLSKGLDGQGPQKLSGTNKDTGKIPQKVFCVLLNLLLFSIIIIDDSVNVREEVFASCFRLLRFLAAGQKNVLFKS